jgi:hypothetical protein
LLRLRIQLQEFQSSLSILRNLISESLAKLSPLPNPSQVEGKKSKPQNVPKNSIK